MIARVDVDRALASGEGEGPDADRKPRESASSTPRTPPPPPQPPASSSSSSGPTFAIATDASGYGSEIVDVVSYDVAEVVTDTGAPADDLTWKPEGAEKTRFTLRDSVPDATVTVTLTLK